MSKISKVVYGGQTLIDLTADTVTSEQLKKGFTAHGPDGELVTGTCTHDADTQDANAAASEILSGKTAYVKGAKRTGTMKNNGGAKYTIKSKDDKPAVAQGYHDGSGYSEIDSAEKAKIIPENIRQGVTLLGVEGNMSGTEGANAQNKEVTPSTTEQIILPDTDEGYNYLAEVKVLPIPYIESDNEAGGKTVTIG